MSEPTARKRGRRGSPESWSVDTHVGQRVRMRRTLLGMSQEKLGEAIGLTFQQVQKYERGSNRISAGTLYRLSQVLDVPVSFFFDAYSDLDGARHPNGRETAVADTDSQISRREARLLRLWRAAPAHVSDEMLSLLSALSPDLRDPPDGTEEQSGGNTPPGSSRTGEDTDGTADAAMPLEDAAPRTAVRSVRGDSHRHKTPKTAKTAAKTVDGSANDRPRRRHGAVWDPTDILRASKPQTRD